jgi:hypothetical protein
MFTLAFQHVLPVVLIISVQQETRAENRE